MLLSPDPTRRKPVRRGLLRPRRLVGGAVAAAALTLLPAAAQAHVHADPQSTASGGYPVITFQVPTESATASTVSVEVSLPTGTPLSSVGVRPVPGWTAHVVEGKLPEPVTVDGTTLTEAPTSVTWTADAGQGIAPGEFQLFQISAGPLPAAGTTLSFPTRQTYSDGSVVAWDEPQTGAQEPQNPVPSFTVTAASADGHDHDGSTDAAGTTADTTAVGAPSWVAWGGLVLGALALGVAGYAATARRRGSQG